MVVEARSIELEELDLAYLGLFLGQRVNEMVTKRMSREGFKATRESHGYLIQHLVDSERTITELARRMGVTQQAASKAVAELADLGVVEAASSRDRRAKTIRLSKQGWRGVKAVRQARAEIDRRLAKTIGKRAYAKAKGSLIAGLNELGGIEKIRSRRVRHPQ